MNRRLFLKALGLVPTTQLLTQINFNRKSNDIPKKLTHQNTIDKRTDTLTSVFDFTKSNQLILLANSGSEFYTDFSRNLAYELSDPSDIYYHCTLYSNKKVESEKLISLKTDISYLKIRFNKTTQLESIAIEKARFEVINSNLNFIDNSKTSISDLKNILTNANKKNPLPKYLFINLKSLITESVSYKNIFNETAVKLKQLKELALECNTTIFAMTCIYRGDKNQNNLGLGLNNILTDDLSSPDQILLINDYNRYEIKNKKSHVLEFTKFGPHQKFEYVYTGKYNSEIGKINEVEILF